jgi:bacterioferritin (cytochrome b1)
MDTLQMAIEGYNKEKVQCVERIIEVQKLGSGSSSANFKDIFIERIKQIDTIIERLLTLEYFPSIKNKQ